VNSSLFVQLNRHSSDRPADRVMFGGVSILSLLIGDPAYMKNALRQDLWRAGHAHAGVWLVLALVALRYVDAPNLSGGLKWFVRLSIPIAAIVGPAGFFLSVLAPDATAPNALINLVYLGAILLALGVLVLGIGLVRRPSQRCACARGLREARNRSLGRDESDSNDHKNDSQEISQTLLGDTGR
jgi:hypothetical protein